MKVKKITLSFYFLFFALIAHLSFGQANEQQLNQIKMHIKNIERTYHGRMGVFAINTANQQYFAYRSRERFPMCSTSKLMTVGAILKRNAKYPGLLERKIHYLKTDIQQSGYAPITSQHISDGMTIMALCKAAMIYSDNGAANLLMKELGGPQAVKLFARFIGDSEFRLDRWEPFLNTAVPGDKRDTTTPQAMANSLKKLVLGNILSKSQRQLLQSWLMDNKTGNSRIRSGVPKNWIVGDKTGTGSYGTTNDIGIIWPPNCQPIIMAIYFTQSDKNAIPRDKVIQSATLIVLNTLASYDPCIKLTKT